MENASGPVFHTTLFQNGWISLLVLLVSLALGWWAYRLVFRCLRRLIGDEEDRLGPLILRHSSKPLQLLFPVLAALFIVPSLHVPVEFETLLRQGLSIGLIISLFWALVATVLLTRDAILQRYRLDVEDNLQARAVHTQLNVLAKILIVLLCLVGAAFVLMTFERIRQIGVGLLASAGLVGIIAGFSAQKTLSTLFAGLQLALTQPIRLDDVVIIDGEWGRIEEISLTHVVVRIWDQRRLVVPVQRFLEQSFQNWTRTDTEILGTVYLYTDYRIDVEAVRNRLQQLVEASELWDGRVCGLQVTNLTDRTVELRCLVSAADASQAWSLRCQVREEMLGYLQASHPDSLPRLRLEGEGGSLKL